MLLSLVTVFTTSFMLALSGALMPGPVLTVTVSESTRRGAVTGPLMMFGHGILEFGLVVALMAGLAPFLARDDVFTVVSLLGGGILLWMSWSMIKELPTIRLNFEGNSEKTRNLVLAGILLSIANPYWLIWWATIGLGYIVHAAKLGLIGVAVFFAGHILADLAWYSMISFGISRGRRFFTDVFYRRLLGGCAAFLFIFACYFFYSGIGKGVTLLQNVL